MFISLGNKKAYLRMTFPSVLGSRDGCGQAMVLGNFQCHCPFAVGAARVVWIFLWPIVYTSLFFLPLFEGLLDKTEILSECAVKS